MSLAVGAVGQRLDQRQVGGLDRLAVRRLEVGVDEAADVGAGAGVVDVDLVAARGDDGRLVGADGDAANRLHAGRRQGQDDLRPLVGARRRLGALVDPELDEGQLLRRQRLFPLRRHRRFFGAAAELDEEAAGGGAGHDRAAAAAAFHERLVVAHVQLAFRLEAVMAGGAFVVEDRLDLLGVGDGVLASQLDDRDRAWAAPRRAANAAAGSKTAGRQSREAGTHAGPPRRLSH